MSRIIAVAGKGGVGKTTLSALVVRRLIARGLGPVLAVDADPNTCLDGALGVRVEKTVGGLREDAREATAHGSDKRRFLELRLAESLVEAKDFDLLAMGRPEGPGCYCYANAVLRDILSEVAAHYPLVVVDNEAGLENLARRVLGRADALLLVADPSARGLMTVRRLYGLARDMGIGYARLAVVVNRTRGGVLPPDAQALRAFTHADVLVGLPADEALAALDEAGRPVGELPEGNPLVQGVDELLDALGFTAKVQDGPTGP